MTLSQEAFLAFSGAILLGVVGIGAAYTYGPQKRFRVVDRATGEVESHHWTRRGAWRRAHSLNWAAPCGCPVLHGYRPRYATERVR